MEARTKWLWIVTGANAAVLVLFVFVIFGMMVAMAVLAPEISGWPLFLVLAIGTALSGAGLKLARRVASNWPRRIGYFVNGCALAINTLVIVGIAFLFLTTTRQRFIIPKGYKGDVYVIYRMAAGESLNATRWSVTFPIPQDGVLRTRANMLRNWTRSEYFYQSQDGTLERISNFWPSTIHPTRENLENDKDFGVYFPRTGSFTDSVGCSIEYTQFYVGTKAHLQTKYHEIDLARYSHDHLGACNSVSR